MVSTPVRARMTRAAKVSGGLAGACVMASVLTTAAGGPVGSVSQPVQLVAQESVLPTVAAPGGPGVSVPSPIGHQQHNGVSGTVSAVNRPILGGRPTGGGGSLSIRGVIRTVAVFFGFSPNKPASPAAGALTARPKPANTQQSADSPTDPKDAKNADPAKDELAGARKKLQPNQVNKNHVVKAVDKDAVVKAVRAGAIKVIHTVVH